MLRLQRGVGRGRPAGRGLLRSATLAAHWPPPWSRQDLRLLYYTFPKFWPGQSSLATIRYKISELENIHVNLTNTHTDTRTHTNAHTNTHTHAHTHVHKKCTHSEQAAQRTQKRRSCRRFLVIGADAHNNNAHNAKRTQQCTTAVAQCTTHIMYSGARVCNPGFPLTSTNVTNTTIIIGLLPVLKKISELYLGQLWTSVSPGVDMYMIRGFETWGLLRLWQIN